MDDPPRKVSPWVKAFVLFHAAAITIWALPNPPATILQGERAPVGSDYLLVWNHAYLKPLPPVRHYVLTTGFWQYWDMFAPNPVSVDFYGSAQVVYRSGAVRTYRYPRMADLPVGQRYFMERYRKFFERVHPEEHAHLWPVFAGAVARKMHVDPDDPPVQVRLVRHFRHIAPPGEPPQTEHTAYMFYTHRVQPEDLAPPGSGG
jgi:hypothetical protein